jgi:hypothetical protein
MENKNIQCSHTIKKKIMINRHPFVSHRRYVVKCTKCSFVKEMESYEPRRQ